MWRIEFESDKFLPYLPEDCQANPGAYGFELALWVSQQLAKKSMVTSYPEGEDWGWFIEYSEGEIEIQIGCSSVAEMDEGYSGNPITWSIFIKPHKTLAQRFQGASLAQAEKKLSDAILSVLAESGIATEIVE